MDGDGPGLPPGGPGIAGDLIRAQGFNIGMNNFEAAGQVVFHAHLHVIPRYYTDGLHLFPQESYKPGDIEKTGEQLRRVLAKMES